VACDISILVPVYNEEENILPLAQEVAEAFAQAPWSYELVFVDDASTDQTWSKIQEARRRDSRIRGLRHAHNSGQSAALWTGVRATVSPIIGTMDGDRQNDPTDLPKLLAELPTFDFVCGVRTKRQDNFRRRMSAAVARYARRLILRVGFADTGCALRVFKRSALRGVFPFNGLHRFLPILVYGGGATTLEVPVNHRPRVAGISKYGILDRLGRGIVDLLAIAWYQRRRLGPVPFEEAEERLDPDEPACASSSSQKDTTSSRSHEVGSKARPLDSFR
jgi:dolichol-phosphate mannosyltransferase